MFFRKREPAAQSVGDASLLIDVQHLSKIYNEGKENEVRALDDISLAVPWGQFLCILGQSGSGKSTLMNILGCLDIPTYGIYRLGGQAVSDMKPSTLSGIRNREIGFIFQGFNLIPALTAIENVELPLIYRGMPRAKRHALAVAALEQVGLGHRLHHRPSEMSGGQQQRVAIARALISHPKVLLLDEPLGALDLKLRKDMQQELKKIQKSTGITFVFVTHDQEEALSMSDTIVVMNEGKIQQIGTPTDIYNEPKNAFVADFIGESNIVDGVMLEDYKVRFAGHTFACLDTGFGKNEPVDVVIRPEDVDIVPAKDAMLNGLVTSVTFMGVHNEIIVDIAGFKWMIQTTDSVDEGAHIGLSLDPDAIHIMKKSKYSGMFGDYSSFSNELDELSNPGGESEE